MIYTPQEITQALGLRIRARRLGLGWTQAETAGRAGVAYRTWRRLESEGKASIEDMVRAAVALRCDQDLANLFPEPAASSMDDLLAGQKPRPVRRRARSSDRQP
ncbi:MAG: hypothetical protein RL367_485 [Pseudomonadota bacterium]|jgi:transcriptional regulator with XRE-family HTH domain